MRSEIDNPVVRGRKLIAHRICKARELGNEIDNPVRGRKRPCINNSR